MILLVACTGKAPPAGPAPMPTVPMAETPTDLWVGTWTSAPCGTREYERVLVLAADGYRVQERVSPCPPEAQCVWSGIVEYTGAWAPAGTGIQLDPPREARDEKASAALPGLLRYDHAGRLTEPAPGGEGLCVYGRG